MSVNSERVVTLESGATGKVIGYQIESGEAGKALSAKDVTTMICDYAGCKKGLWPGPGHEKGPKVLVIDDPANLPEGVHALLTLVDWESGRKVFCSMGCLIRYGQTDYKPCRLPRDHKGLHLAPKDGYSNVPSRAQVPDGVAGVPA